MQKEILKIPKVELHSHLEGTIPPSLVRKIAKRNNITLKEGLFTNEDTFAWVDFVAFLQAYDEASFCLRKSIDYEDTLSHARLKALYMLKLLYLQTTRRRLG